MLKATLISAILLFVALSTVAQTNSVQVNVPPAPEAAVFGKFGDIPVGEFTGSAQVNVPVYTLAHRGFSLPIGLSYHSNGIRVSEEAGWVGLGWTLNTGGMITRSIRGYDDFGNQRWTPGCGADPNIYTNYWTLSNSGEIPTGFSEQGRYIDTDRYTQYAQNSITVTENDSDGYDVTEEPYSIGGENYPWSFFCQYGEHVKDLESDLYSYNLLGYSGKFIISNDGNIVFLEATDLKVEVVVNGEDDVNWIFTTPQGVKIFVGTERNSRQLTYTASRTATAVNGLSSAPDIFGLPCNQAMDAYISTWYIDRVVLPTGEIVDFNYAVAENDISYPVPSFSTNMKDKIGEDVTASGGISNSDDAPNRIYGKTVTLIAYDNVYLESIEIPAAKERVVFEVQEGRLDLMNGILLDKITVYRQGTEYKSFDFTYDYFVSPVTSLDERWEDDFYGTQDARFRDTDDSGNPVIEFDISGLLSYTFEPDYIGKRLRLQSILEFGSDGNSQLSPFVFDYHEDLPVKTSYAVDHWGHYNGQLSNRTFTPAVSTSEQEFVLLNCGYTEVNENLEIADRNPHLPYTQAGLLRAVTYPTGGSTELDYEANFYSEIGQSFIDETVEKVINYRSYDLCESSASPTPIAFVYNDNNSEGNVDVRVEMSWRFKACDPNGCDTYDCLSIVDGVPTAPGGDFYYRIENSAGEEVFSRSWTEIMSNLVEFTSPSGSFYHSKLAIPLTDFINGETYYLKIEKASGLSLAPNLLEAKFSLSYYRTRDTPVIYELIGEEEESVVVTNDGYCALVPASEPIPFVIEDNNGNINSCARVTLNWNISNCDEFDCEEPAPPCLPTGSNDADDGEVIEVFSAFFRFVILDDEGNDVESWNWNNGSGGILYSPAGSGDNVDEEDIYLSSAIFDIHSLEEGRTYYLKIESFGGSDLPMNLNSARIKVSWPVFGTRDTGQGGGVRIAEVVDRAGGQIAQTKTYHYETPQGQPSGQIYKEPINYYYTTQGKISSRTLTYGSTISSSSSTHYLNRLSNSVTPLSSSYSGSCVNYNQVRIEYGNGENGYVEKEFYRSNNRILTSDFNERSIPLFYNQRNGSILNEKYYSNTGQLVKENTYNYNENWGVRSSSVLNDPRLQVQYGFRVLSPRFTVSLAPSNYPLFSRSCWDGVGGPEVFAYVDVPQWHYLESKTEKTFGEDGSFAESTTTYEYEDVHFNLIEESISGAGSPWTTKYKYAEELGSFLLDEDIHMTSIPLEVEAPNGVTYLTEYDATQLVPYKFTETYQDESSIIRSQITAFDDNGYPLSMQRFGYDTEEFYIWKPDPAPEGLLKEKTYLDWTEEYFYNDFRQLEKTVAIDDQPVEYEYDPHGRLHRVKARPSTSTGGDFNIINTMTYDMGGPNIVTSETVYSDAPTQTVRSFYDGLGRPTQTELNGVTKSQTVYDNLGRVFASTYLPGSLTQYAYDGSPLNRLKEETYPDGNSVTYRYSAEDNEWVTTRINERDFPTKSYTDILGRDSKMEDAMGNITDQVYDGFGRLVAISGPAGGYSYTYDDRNRLIVKKVPGALATSYFYDDNTDLLCASIDGNLNRLSNTYDAYQRITEVFREVVDRVETGCDVDGESVLTYVYDGYEIGQENNPIYTGKLSYSTAAILGATGLAETAYALDEFGRVIGENRQAVLDGDNLNAGQSFKFNHADWTLSVSGSSSDQQFTYDDFGRVILEASNGIVTEMRYNDQDQLLYKIFDGGLARENYEYNARGWLTNINVLRPEVFSADDPLTPVGSAVCPYPLGEDETYITTQVVTPVEFFELLCDGNDVVVPDVEECPPPDPTCLEEFADYELDIFFDGNFNQHELDNYTSTTDWKFTLAALQGVDLPNYDYCLEGDRGSTQPGSDVAAHFGVCLGNPTIDIAPIIEQDLIFWLEDNGYAYEEVRVSYERTTLQIRIRQTNYGFTTATIGGYFFGKSKKGESGYFSHFIDYPFLRYNVRKLPCDENTFLPTGKEPGKGSGQTYDFTGNTMPPISAADFEFPSYLNEVILPDNRQLWLFDFELRELAGAYTIEERFPVVSDRQLFEVVIADGSVYIVNFTGLLTYRNNSAAIREINVIAMGPNPGEECPPPVTECDATTQADQQTSLDAICAQTLALFASGQITFPIEVAIVQLCNGEITYVLNELVDQIDGSHTVLNTFEIDEDGLTVQVATAEPLFAMEFDHQPNGNIEQLKWKVRNRPTAIYDYGYDPIDRVGNAEYWEEYYLEETQYFPDGQPYVIQNLQEDRNGRYNASFTYDGGGNIQSIDRNGVGYACGPEGQIDDLKLTYGGLDGQQLINVIDSAPDLQLRKSGFRPKPSANHAGSEYEYDDNGNMTRDPHKLLTIEYNFLNLPQTIRKGGMGEVLKVIYDATGRKWKKTSTVQLLDDYGDPTDETYTETRTYHNGVEYFGEGETATQLHSINTSSNGRVAYQYDDNGLLTGNRVEYYHKDHLGNVRLALSDLDGDGAITAGDILDPSNEIVQERHYYPFGLTHTGPWYATVVPDNAYRYNGKELDEATGLYDYGARYYDPAIARWGQVDPLAEEKPWVTPYNFVQNDPISRIDPDGLTDYTINKKTGEVTQVGEANDQPDRVLRTNNKGEVKYKKNGDARIAFGGIEKGILSDGQNFRHDDNIIDVGGEGEPTLSGVEDFITNLGEHVGAEMSGAYLSNTDSKDADISKVYLDEYDRNGPKKAFTSLTKLYTDENLKGMHTNAQFHTHPTNISGVSRADIERPSGTTNGRGDIGYRNGTRGQFHHYYILTRTASRPSRVMKIDFTDY